MYRYGFVVDNALRITSWDKGFEDIIGTYSSNIRGVPYTSLLPQILSGSADAVREAIECGKPLLLQHHKSPCFHGLVEVSISIRPLATKEGGKGPASGAHVEVELFPPAERRADKLLPRDFNSSASTLAHGVRNPLNAIKGAVVYLKEKYSDEKILVEFAKIMEEEILRLDTFITKFLSTSASEITLSTTNINELLRKIESFTSLQAHAHSISCSYSYGDIPPVMADSFQLEHAILNVINNAIEAMPGGGSIDVATHIENHSDDSFVVITISDTGPGIPSARIASSSRHQRNKRGKGYGLHIAREVLRQHNGHFKISSNEGLGTIVKFLLPAQEAQAL